METLIKVKGLVDVEGPALVHNAFVLVKNDRIESTGPWEAAPPDFPDERTLDFSENYLLPGLINCHAHLCLASAGRPFYHPQTDHAALLRASVNIKRELMSGVTALRDCGDQNGVIFSLRQALAEGILPAGPRLFLCGPPLTITGGHTALWGGEVDGPYEIARAARARIRDGADFVKIMATGGGTPGTYPGYAAYSVEELKTAAETARRIGKMTSAHCRGIPGIENALAAGIDWLEHSCFELPDGRLKFNMPLAEKMAAQGTIVTPTIQLFRDSHARLKKKKEAGDLTAAEQAVLDMMPGVIEEKYKALENFTGLGVRCVAGNDAGLPYTEFGLFWKEIQAFTEAGMPALQALASATIVPARALGVDQDIGSIKPGKKADLLVVRDNPVDNVSALSRPLMVMLGGRPVTD